MSNSRENLKVTWSSDCTVRIAQRADAVDDPTWPIAVARALRAVRIPGCLDIVPAHNTVTLWLDPMRCAHVDVLEMVRRTVDHVDQRSLSPTRPVVIPACFGDEYGIDLGELCLDRSITQEHFIQRFCATTFTVRFLGFMPGFPYLTGLPDGLTAMRLSTPRLHVPAGSVAIGGTTAGIYPVASPGGWRLIGRTPLRLFDPQRPSPAFLAPGDSVQFKPISVDEFSTACGDER